MRHKAIGEFVFYFKKDSVVMDYHNQFTAFHLFDCRNKKPMEKFAQALRQQKRMDINKVYEMKKAYKLDAVAVMHTSVLEKT